MPSSNARSSFQRLYPALALAAVAAAALLGLAGPSHAADASCAPEGDLKFICGAKAPEDLVAIPGTPLILTGGGDTQGTGGLFLIDPRRNTLSRLPVSASRQDRKLYPDCAGPPDPKAFGAHGLSIKSRGRGEATLYVIGHGGREAVEVFSLRTGGGAPRATWIGCVLAPTGASLNSLVSLKDGAILATSILNAPSTFQDIFAGRPTGMVYAREPGTAFTALPYTNLSGDNGIEVSADGKYLFVAATGERKLFRYLRSDMSAPPASVSLYFLPDNARWAPDGRLLVAGQGAGVCGAAKCPDVYNVVAVDPVSLKAETVVRGPVTQSFGGVSGALIAAGRVWLASHDGERVAYLPFKPN